MVKRNKEWSIWIVHDTTVVLIDNIFAYEQNPTNVITKVIISDSVKRLPRKAFYSSQYHTVILGTGIESTGELAFQSSTIGVLKHSGEE